MPVFSPDRLRSDGCSVSATVFRVAKQYGINHYRCHSFTPPRAALEAADIEGIYYQIELPLWGYIKRENTVLNDFLKREGDMLLEHFGNHPSFMMLGLGNELDAGDRCGA